MRKLPAEGKANCIQYSQSTWTIELKTHSMHAIRVCLFVCLCSLSLSTNTSKFCAHLPVDSVTATLTSQYLHTRQPPPLPLPHHPRPAPSNPLPAHLRHIPAHPSSIPRPPHPPDETQRHRFKQPKPPSCKRVQKQRTRRPKPDE